MTLINASPDPVDLTGWNIADRLDHRCPVPLTGGVQLGNGGADRPAALKVHGVSCTAQQARREGWTVVF
jgi:hypothetical protein